MSNPILDECVRHVRDETAIDIRLHTEGWRYFLTFAQPGPTIGPMDHSQTWFCLMGVLGAMSAPKTLDTPKRRSRRVRDEALAAAKAKHEEKKNADAATD
jgi:hypothetical protein